MKRRTAALGFVRRGEDWLLSVHIKGGGRSRQYTPGMTLDEWRQMNAGDQAMLLTEVLAEAQGAGRVNE